MNLKDGRKILSLSVPTKRKSAVEGCTNVEIEIKGNGDDRVVQMHTSHGLES